MSPRYILYIRDGHPRSMEAYSIWEKLPKVAKCGVLVEDIDKVKKALLKRGKKKPE